MPNEMTHVRCSRCKSDFMTRKKAADYGIPMFCSPDCMGQYRYVREESNDLMACSHQNTEERSIELSDNLTMQVLYCTGCDTALRPINDD